MTDRFIYVYTINVEVVSEICCHRHHPLSIPLAPTLTFQTPKELQADALFIYLLIEKNSTSHGSVSSSFYSSKCETHQQNCQICKVQDRPDLEQGQCPFCISTDARVLKSMILWACRACNRSCSPLGKENFSFRAGPNTHS